MKLTLQEFITKEYLSELRKEILPLHNNLLTLRIRRMTPFAFDIVLEIVY